MRDDLGVSRAPDRSDPFLNRFKGVGGGCGLRAATAALAFAAGLAACSAEPPRPPTPYTARPVLGSWLLSVTAGESSWGFYLYLPDEPPASGAPYPLLVHLRGFGNFGWEPNPALLAGGPLEPLRRSDRALDPAGRERLDPRVRRSIVVIPRLPYFDPGYHHPLGHYSAETLQKVIDWVEAHYPVDERRLYLTGVSDGGGGVWEFTASHPGEPAAVVPIACALRVPLSEGMREVPTWIFHGFDDDHEENSDPAFQAVTGVADVLAGYPHQGGDRRRPAEGDFTVRYAAQGGLGPWRAGVVAPGRGVGYTLYAAGGHDVGPRTFASEELWRWMYAQSRDRAPARARPAR